MHLSTLSSRLCKRHVQVLRWSPRWIVSRWFANCLPRPSPSTWELTSVYALNALDWLGTLAEWEHLAFPFSSLIPAAICDCTTIGERLKSKKWREIDKIQEKRLKYLVAASSFFSIFLLQCSPTKTKSSRIPALMHLSYLHFWQMFLVSISIRHCLAFFPWFLHLRDSADF